jgi:hypothetical protein
MAFLRTELQLSYTIEGLHFSAWAFGAILAGINGDHAIRLLGRRSVLWGGGAGMAGWSHSADHGAPAALVAPEYCADWLCGQPAVAMLLLVMITMVSFANRLHKRVVA